jgi:hypothetical protein
MSKLRGDDALLSLMDEMSSQQGYAKAVALEITSNTTASRETTRVRLAAEVHGYPSTNTLAGTAMIWNPYIQVFADGISKHVIMAPTNPQVEVFRRRAYERFKAEFRENFERVAVNATAKSGPSNLWKELSVPSMMERWHFDVKLEEFLMLRDEYTGAPWQTSFCSSCFTTSQIKAAMTQNDRLLMDPILISTGRIRRKRRREKREEPAPKFRSASSLFSDELKFEWMRTWKRKAGDKFQEGALKPIFESSQFQKKQSRISRSIFDSATELEASFLAEVTKRAALECTTVSSSSKKSVPKIVVDDDDVHVKLLGLSFNIHLEHYHKLQIMFDRMHPSNTDRAAHERAFHSALFCLLARYDMLQGAGLQSSMHGSVFDVLLHHFDCRLECFASPLNSRYERFCSAFPDTDSAFGSVGSFFDYNFSSVGGSYQANPPFSANFIRLMYETMDRALQSCEKPLMFVVFVPTWKDTAGWELLKASLHTRKYVVLSQTCHYYCEGTQHRRKDRYRVASFDTSVFFLQNDAARSKWPIADSQIADLKTAFSVDPNQVQAAEKIAPPKHEEPPAVSSA